MIKFSLLVMVGFTVLISFGLRWRDQRLAALTPGKPARPRGLFGGFKANANRWVTAAALAAIATIAVFGGLHWLRVLTGG